jgi:hypothetical protein
MKAIFTLARRASEASTSQVSARQGRKFRWRLWVCPALLAPALVAGCLCRGDCGGGAGGCGAGGGLFGNGGMFDKCATIPQGAIPPPIGTHTNELLGRQVAKAEMDQFVLYLYEWSGDTANFGPFGSRHMERLATRLPSVTYPVIIEPDCDANLNESRRLTVIAFLEQRGITDAGARVRLGYPIAEGIYGEEAPRIYRQMLSPQSGSYGRGSFQGFQGGFGSGSFSGGFGGGFGGGLGGFGGMIR